MGNYIMKIFLVILTTIITLSSLKGIELSKDKNCITIKNSIYTMSINPEKGGRIVSWKNNKSGLDHCYWNATGHHAGLLDDKGVFTGMVYSAKIEKESSGLVKLRLTSSKSSNGLIISKTIIVRHNQAKFDVVYEYINESDQIYHNSLMIRNYFFPGGKDLSNVRYFISGTKGVESWKYPHKDLGAWFKKLSSNWFAIVNKTTHTGVALVVNSPRLRAFYGFMARKNPTMEWMWKLKIKPRTTIKVPMSIIMMQKASNVIFACPEAVAYADFKIEKNKLKINTGIEPIAEVYEQAESLQTKFQLDYLVNKKRLKTNVQVFLTLPSPVWVGQLSQSSTFLPLDKKGTYAVKAGIFIGHRKIGEWEQPVYWGEPTSEYYMGQALKKKIIKIMDFDQTSKRRGYGIHLGGLNMPYVPYDAQKSLKLDLGPQELESIELGIATIKNIGHVNVRLKTQEGLSAKNVKLYFLKKVGGNYEDAKALFPFKVFSGLKNTDNRVWVVLNCIGLRPGKHNFEVIIEPGDAPSTTIPVSFRIWDVKRANRDNADLTMWHLLSWNVNYIGAGFADDMKKHGIQELKIAWHNRFWRDKVKLSLNEAGKLIVDFKGTEKYFKLARSCGMDKIAIMYRLVNKRWFKQLGKISVEKRQYYRKIVIKNMVDFLIGMGFKRIEFFCMDEPPTTVGRKESQKLIELKQLHPKLRIATTVNHMSNKMLNGLAPGIDVWYMSSFTIYPMLQMIKQKEVNLGKDDDIRAYYAFARVYSKSYDILRSKGWYSGWLRLNCYGIYNYFKPSLRPDQIIFLDKQKNIRSTPAWEGLRDGFDDFAYIRRLQVLYTKLAKEKTNSELKNKLKKSENFFKQAFQSKKTGNSIIIKKTYRYGYDFYKMEEPGRHLINKMRSLFMPLLADLEKVNREKTYK